MIARQDARWLIALLLFAVSGVTAVAQAPDAGTIVVQGSGVVETVPDIADITIGVSTEDMNPAQAIDGTSAAMKRVVDDAKRAGIAARDIQTNALQLTQYRDQKNVLRFRAVNAVRLRVREIARLGAVTRDLVSSGANEVHAIRFSTADPMPHLDEARRQAVADATRRAEVLAGAAGRRLGAVIEITESTADDPGIVTMAREMRQAVPVEPGQMALRASVQIKWRLEP